MVAAGAVGLVHKASLVIDDAMDESEIRHGKPTIYARYGKNMSMAVGGTVQGLANVQAALVSQAVAQEVADTIVTMYAGQASEDGQRHRLDRTRQDYLKVVDEKTGELFAAPCRAGGLVIGLSQEKLKALGAYGQSLGRAYQIMDDVRDVIGNEKQLGKPVGSDAKNGVYTLPVLLALRGDAGPKVAERVQKLLEKEPVRSAVLAKVLIDSGVVEMAIAEARKHTAQAVAELDGFADSPAIKGLKWLPDALIDSMLELPGPYQGEGLITLFSGSRRAEPPRRRSD
jgi:heptaprenyl diphosphate synthase